MSARSLREMETIEEIISFNDHDEGDLTVTSPPLHAFPPGVLNGVRPREAEAVSETSEQLLSTSDEELKKLR